MTAITAGPVRTHALVVGVEQYQGTWKNLDGPAAQAVRFREWLIGRGVPAANIALFLSPLPANQAIAEGVLPTVQPATSAAIEDYLTRTLPQKQGELLWVFWGGHGIFTVEQGRKLLYADANDADKRALDVKELLDTLRSDLVLGFPTQIVVTDACAQEFDDTKTVPLRALPRGTFTKHCTQLVLVAASTGELATHFGARKIGAFSEALLGELAQVPAGQWPQFDGDDGLASRLERRFEQLRAQGEVKQTPEYWYSAWPGSRREVWEPNKLISVGVVTQAQQMELVTLLMQTTTMTDSGTRDVVYTIVPLMIAHNVKRHAAARIDTINLVRTCANYEGGIESLINAVADLEGNSLPVQALRAWFERVRPV